MYKKYDFVHRADLTFRPDAKRVICQIYNDRDRVINRLLEKVGGMEESLVEQVYKQFADDFSWRHRDLEGRMEQALERISGQLSVLDGWTKSRRMVLASYFLNEYSVEAAALFNPSMVEHPEQGNLDTGSRRFILSLRACGEGHISSIAFMSGMADKEGKLNLDKRSAYATLPQTIKQGVPSPGSNELIFDPNTDISERIVFPVADEERNGIEDVRLVRFEDEGEVTYYGTFTAYDGHNIQSKILQTNDFLTFQIHKLNGPAIKDKGMALFPRKINGRYAMISRQDDVNIRIMFSDSLLDWQESSILIKPEFPWELAKAGNCGSPIETDRGWLLLTHGVGPLRKYAIGICLLDKDDPTKVIARLPRPLIAPTEEEREGYVPNVVYSCGGMLHHRRLIVPYAMSDAITGFVNVDLDDLMQQME